MNAQKSTIQIAIPAILSALLLALLSPLGSVIWSQSPVSPIPPDAVPERFSDTSPTTAGNGSAPSSRVLEALSRLSSAGFWSSPLPWTAVGIVFFGGLAWGIFLLLRRRDASNRAS